MAVYGEKWGPIFILEKSNNSAWTEAADQASNYVSSPHTHTVKKIKRRIQSYCKWKLGMEIKVSIGEKNGQYNVS